jgi:hypothetical protein
MNVTDSYCTPLWFAQRVGNFVTDPCSNPRSHIAAIIKYMLETGHDGLALPWFGRTWLNHPYSDPMPWMLKLHAELGQACTEAVVLPKHDHSTEWWQVMVQPHEGFTCDQWQLHKRMQFDIPPDVLERLTAEHIAEWAAKHPARAAAGKKPPKLNTSNNFCTSVIHWRRHEAPRLEISDIASLWVQV